MVHGKILVSVAFVLFFSINALAVTPEIDGLAGAGRGGIAKEALVSNPAAIALLKQNAASLAYTRTLIPDLGNAGGIQQFAGIYDGSSELAHGGLGYLRESRRVDQGSGSVYNDSTTVRAVFGRQVYGDLMMGVTTNYTILRQSGHDDSKYFHGDVGFIYTLFSDIHLGLTAENVTDKAGERPRSFFGALRYDFQGPLTIYGDLGRISSGPKDGKYDWSLGAEIAFFEQLVARAGLFRDPVTDTRGYALGLSWNSPRTSFEYALRKSLYTPNQVDHVFGVSFVF